MSEREAAKQRSQMLKELRTAHQSTVETTQARLKEHKGIRRQLCQDIRAEPKSVPEIAEANGIPAHQVLWHITAMKKYDLVVETGMCGEYYLYQMAAEAKK